MIRGHGEMQVLPEALSSSFHQTGVLLCFQIKSNDRSGCLLDAVLSIEIAPCWLICEFLVDDDDVYSLRVPRSAR